MNGELLEEELELWMTERLGVSLKPETVREIVKDLLTGGNYRSSTEGYTKELLIIYYTWLLEICRRYKAEYGKGWKKELYDQSHSLPLSHEAGKLVNWFVAFGEKTRSNCGVKKAELPEYFEEFFGAIETTLDNRPDEFPRIEFSLLTEGAKDSFNLKHEELLWILATAGAMTLSLRGSQKSFWGNRIETAFLRTVLTLLGLEEDKNFWLDVRGDDESEFWRQVDAEVQSCEGNDRVNRIPIEYGLIGEGNPEISADKMGRVGRRGGIVIVDKLNEDSKAYQNAIQEGAKVIVLRDNEKILLEIYEFLSTRCPVELVSPPGTVEEVERKISELPLGFFE